MNNKLFAILIFSFSVVVFSVLISPTFASSKADIVFPVAELGGCQSETECKTYCDNPDNYSACFAFAKKHNLLEGPLADKSEKELEKFAQVMNEGGPGGCQSQRECDAYCDDIDNINECVTFAERHDLMPPSELDEAKKVMSALARGVKMPGGCTNKKTCEAYCFGSGGAEEGGFIEGHMDECVRFGLEAGFMGEKEAKMVRLTKGRGPGGCRGPECDDFCDEPKNREVCGLFLEDLMRENPDLKLEDIIPENDLREMREGFAEMKKEMPPEMQDCLARLDPGFAGFFAGTISPSPSLGMKIQKLMPQCMAEFFGEGTSPELIDCMMSSRGREGGDECFKKHGFPPKFAPGGEMGPPQFPPEVEECMKERGLWDEMMSFRGPPPPEFEKKVGECFMEFGGGDFPGGPPDGRGGPGFQPPGFGADPEECMDNLRDRCDQQFTGDEGKKRCVEEGKRVCFMEVKGFVPPGHNGERPPFSGVMGPPPEMEGVRAEEFENQMRERFEGQVPEQFREQFEQQFQEQFQEQFQQQYQQEFQSQFQEQFQQMAPIEQIAPTEVAPSSRRIPTIEEFLLGLVWTLVL